MTRRRSSSCPAPRRRASGWSPPTPGLTAARRCRRPRRSAARSGSTPTCARSAACSTRWPTASARKLGPLGGAAGALLAIEAGAISGLPRRPRARPVRVPGARSRRRRRGCCSWRPNLGHAANDARRRSRPAAALGGAARDDARAAVRRRAVAARAPRRASCGELLGALDVDPRGLLRLPGPVRPARRCSTGCASEGLAFVAVGERAARRCSRARRRSWRCSRATPST